MAFSVVHEIIKAFVCALEYATDREDCRSVVFLPITMYSYLFQIYCAQSLIRRCGVPVLHIIPFPPRDNIILV